MAQHTLSHFYPTYAMAIEVMADLTALGVPDTDISLIESETDARLPAGVERDAAQSPARSGATLGGGVGMGLGALVGVGAISAPFLDPMVSIGWFVPTIAGAIVGALVGALAGMAMRLGVSDSQSHSFAEGLQRGESLLLIHVDEALAPQAEAVLVRDRRAAATALPQLEDAAPYDVVTRVERVTGPGGETQVRYLRE